MSAFGGKADMANDAAFIMNYHFRGCGGLRMADLAVIGFVLGSNAISIT